MKIFNEEKRNFDCCKLFYNFVLIILLNSCAYKTPDCIIADNMGNLKIGMSAEKANEILSKPLRTIEINQFGSSNYKVLYFNQIRGYFYNTVTICFKNDTLVFWGYPHEFARLDNADLNKIIKIANLQKHKLDSLENEK